MSFPPILFRRGSLRWLASSIALLPVGVESSAQEVWIGAASGNWSANTNWLDGTAPLVTGSDALSLRFTGDGFTNITATNDLFTTFSLNKLLLDYDGGATFTIASASGQALEFTGVSPTISQIGLGNTTIAAPLLLNPNSGSVTIDGSGVSDLIFNGVIGQSANPAELVVDVAGSSAILSVIGLNGSNTFSGGVRLVEGNLSIGKNTALGTGVLRVQGGTLRMTAASLSVGNSISLDADLVITNVNNSILTGAISSNVAGTGLSLRTNWSSPRLMLTAVSTYSGATIIDYGLSSADPHLGAGTLVLDGNTSLLNSSHFDIRAGGTLQIVASPTGAIDRMNDGTPVTLRGGKLLMDGDTVLPSPNATETTGPLSVAGYSTVQVATRTNVSTRLTAASLSRIERGTLFFSGRNLGQPAANNVTNVFFGTAPAGSVGGGGVGVNRSILPYAIGDASPTGITPSFVTYDAVTGIRPLDTTTEYATSLTAVAATANVRIASSAVVPTNTTVNSVLLSGTSIAGTGRLTIASGALLSTAFTAEIAAPLGFGSAEANIFVTGNLTISRDIEGSNGLTKSGAGTLTLRGAKSFSGPLTINAGRIDFAVAAELGTDPGAIVFNGVSPGLVFQGAAPVSLSRPLQISSGFANISNSAAQPTMLEFGAPISGEGGLRLESNRSSPFRLSAANTYLGPTFISGCTVEIGSDAAFGSGNAPLSMNLAVLKLLGPWNSARELPLGGTIDTGGFDAFLSGPIISGGIAKMGAGMLTLTAQSPFIGSIGVAGGTVRLADEGQIRASVVVSSGGRLLLDQSALFVPSRIDNSRTVTLRGGEFAILGHLTEPTREVIGTLALEAVNSAISLTAPGASSVTLVPKTFARTAGDLLVRGTNLGGPATDAYTRLVLPAAPASSSGLLTFIYAASEAASGESFATYDAAGDSAGVIGVKPLATYANVGVIQNPTVATDADVLVAAGASTVGLGNRVQSLTFAPNGTLTLGVGQMLAVDAGRMLARSGGNGASINGAGAVDFGGMTGSIMTYGDLSIDTTVAGSAGWSKSGPGTLTLQSQASPGPAVTILGGALRTAAPHVLSGTKFTLTAPGRFDMQGAPASVGGIAGNGEVTLGTAALTLGTLGGDMIFDGTFSGAGTISIVDGGNPNAIRTFTQANTAFSGMVTLESGKLELRAGQLGSSPIVINGGGLHLSSTVNFRQPFQLNTDLRIDGTGAMTIPFTGGGNIFGPGGIISSAGTSITVQTRLGYTGETRAYSMTLSGNFGALAGTSAVHVGANSTFTIAATFGTDGIGGGRLPDTMPLYLQGGGKFLLIGASGGTSETIGAIHFANLSILALTPNSASRVTLNANSLIRDGRGVISLEATGLGSDLGTANTSRLFLATPPGLVGGSATSGVNAGIIPWAVSNGSLLTYSTTLGVKRLEASEFIASPAAVVAPTNNLRLTAQHVLSAPLTVNSLVLDSVGAAPAGSLSGSGILTITSGMLLAGGTVPAALAVPLNFGAREGLIVSPNANTFTISGAIGGSGGLTVASKGTVVLSGANTFTGPITLDSGTLAIPDAAALGPGTSSLTFAGGNRRVSLIVNNTQAVTLTRELIFAGTETSVHSDGPLTFAGPMTGAGSLFVEGGRLTVRSADYFTGGITVDSGVLEIAGVLGASASDSSVGVNPSGQLTGSAAINREVRVSGTLAPGLDIGTMTTLDFTMDGNATLALAFASATEFDHINVLGTATLSGSVNLALDFRFDPLDDVDSFLILENDGIDAISEAYPAGRFRYVGNDLDQDEAFSVGAQQFRISYTGGDGNDVVLIATPEPGSAALIVLGSAVLSRRPRRDPTRSVR